MQFPFILLSTNPPFHCVQDWGVYRFTHDRDFKDQIPLGENETEQSIDKFFAKFPFFYHKETLREITKLLHDNLEYIIIDPEAQYKVEFHFCSYPY